MDGRGDAARTTVSAPPAHRWADGAFTILLWSMVAALIGRLDADPDLWGHLRFGLDMLRDRTLPSVDPYSYTQDRPWVNHEWLSELQMGIAYRVGGDAGLLALKWLVFGAGCVVVARALRGIPALVRAGLVLWFLWAAAPIATSMRPQLWSLAAAAMLLALLAGNRPSRRLLLVPALFAVWVNLHGGWIVGGLIATVWGLVALATPGQRAWALGIGCACLAATVVNPYGTGLWAFLAETVRVGRDARDWHPLTEAPLADWWPWLVATLGALVLSARRRWPLHAGLAALVLAGLSFRVVRLVPFFVLTVIVYGAPALRRLAEDAPWLGWAPRAPNRAAAGLMLLPATAVLALSVWQQPSTCIPVRGGWAPDRLTGEAMKAAALRGRLITEFGWGEYAIWHFGPDLTVSMDGRRETVYRDPTLFEHDAVLAGDPAALERVRTAGVEYVWLGHHHAALQPWLLAHGYRLDLVGDAGWLAVRADLPVVAAVPAGGPSPRCFPD